MTKTEYQAARSILRANGMNALKWLPVDIERTMWTLMNAEEDELADKADCISHCKEHGLKYTPLSLETIRRNFNI